MKCPVCELPMETPAPTKSWCANCEQKRLDAKPAWNNPTPAKAEWYPKLNMFESTGMTEADAKKLRDLKRGCTYRRLAEIWYPDPDDDRHGNQLFGEDLCREACAILGIDWMKAPEFPHTPEFDKENQSYYGEFYWWQ